MDLEERLCAKTEPGAAPAAHLCGQQLTLVSLGYVFMDHLTGNKFLLLIQRVFNITQLQIADVSQGFQSGFNKRKIIFQLSGFQLGWVLAVSVVPNFIFLSGINMPDSL